MNSIEIENLSKHYRAATFFSSKKQAAAVALDNISLTVKKGECLALVGRNGAGKTTLIKILCTIVTPGGGVTKVAGIDVSRDPAGVRRKIGYAGGDERSFYWRLSGRQNLALFAALQNIQPEQIPQKVTAALELTGLAHKADTSFKSYSSGMRQRLSLARCILHDPEVLILDEPNRGLDPILSERFNAFIKDELINKRGKTVVFATHDLEDALSLSDKVALIERGKLLYFGTPEDSAALRDIMKNAAADGAGFDI